MNKPKWFDDENGFSLLEMVVAMPLITILLLSLGAILCWGLRSYVYLKGDYELISQVRIPLEQVERDLRYAEDIKILSGGLYIFNRNANGVSQTVEYKLSNPGRVNSKISRMSQPITGNTSLADIRITKFDYKLIGERTVYVEIEGMNFLSGKRYSLHTAVTFPRKDGGA